MMNHTACVVCGNHDICLGSVVVDCPVITAEEQRRFTGEELGGPTDQSVVLQWSDSHVKIP